LHILTAYTRNFSRHHKDGIHVKQQNANCKSILNYTHLTPSFEMRFSNALLFSAATSAVVATSQLPCSPLLLVYARATTEPPANVDNASPEQFDAAANRGWSKGYGAAGYSLFSNMTKLIPAATGYPVHYPVNSESSWIKSHNKAHTFSRPVGQAVLQKTKVLRIFCVSCLHSRKLAPTRSLSWEAIHKEAL
jgi:hypothetical protein